MPPDLDDCTVSFYIELYSIAFQVLISEILVDNFLSHNISTKVNTSKHYHNDIL